MKSYDAASGYCEAELSFGVFAGKWEDEDQPDVGSVYDVEIDVDAYELSEGPDARISGVIEAVDDKEVFYLRVAPDCLLMLDWCEHGREVGNDLTIYFNPEQFRITPFGM